MSGDGPEKTSAVLPPLSVTALPVKAFAGIGRRLLAFLLDCLVVMPTALLVAWLMGTLPFLFDRTADAVGVFGLKPLVAKLITNGITILLYDFYFARLVSHGGRTLGMSLLSIAVVDNEGRPPRLSAARTRYLMAGLAMIPAGLGLLAMLWHPQRRGWHDRASRTWVIHEVVLSYHRQAHGLGGKRESPITASVLVFLPGMVLAAAAAVAVVLLIILQRKLTGREALQPRDPTRDT